MSDLDLLPRGQQRESAPLGTMQWLSDTAERVSEHMPLTHSQREQLLHIVVDRMRSQTGATGAAVALEQFGQMVCRASSGDTAPDVGAPLRLEGSFTGRCIQSGAALRCDDSESDPRVNPEACRMLGIRSMLVVPVRNQDRVMGVVEVLSNEPRAFTNAHQSTLESVATVISETFFEPLPDEYVSEPLELDAFAEALQRLGPITVPAQTFDDGTWGESTEIEDAPAPTPTTIFSGLHIRRPVFNKYAIVAFAAITLVASVGTVLLSRSPQSHRPETQHSQAALPGLSDSELQQVMAATKTDPATLTPPAPARSPKRTPARERLASAPTTPSAAPNPLATSVPKGSPPGSQTVSDAAAHARAQIISEPIFRVDPIYPKQAIERHQEGTVVLNAVIARDGHVQTVSILRGDAVFRASAMNAVRQWRYSPTIINGEAVEAETQVTMDFILER